MRLLSICENDDCCCDDGSCSADCCEEPDDVCTADSDCSGTTCCCSNGSCSADCCAVSATDDPVVKLPDTGAGGDSDSQTWLTGAVLLGGAAAILGAKLKRDGDQAKADR